MPKAAQTLTGSDVARVLGVTTAAVTNWKAGGCPSRLTSGRHLYVLADVVNWRLERARESATPLDKEAEQVRKLKAEADRVEIEVAQARGALVPVTEFDRVLGLEHDAMRAALLSLPSRFASLASDRTGCSPSVAERLLADVADQTMLMLQSGDDEGVR